MQARDDSALSRAKTPDRTRTPDATRSIHKLPQRPLTAGAWQSKAATATPQEESASTESTLNRRKVFIEADWVGFGRPAHQRATYVMRLAV